MLKIALNSLLLICLFSCASQNNKLNFSTENIVNVYKDSIAMSKSELDVFNNFQFTCYTSSYVLNKDSTLSLLYIFNNTHIIDYNISKRTIEKIKIVGDNPVKSSFLSLYKLNEKYSILNEYSELYLFSTDSLKSEVTQLDTLEGFKSKDIWLKLDMGFSFKSPFVDDSNVMLAISDGQSNKNKRRYTFAKVNLINKQTNFYQFDRRKEYYQYYDPLRKGIKMEVVGDTLLVSYQFSESVDLFSLNSGQFIGNKVLKSKYQKESIPHLVSNKDEFENERYTIESDYYDVLTYNPFKKCYYRLYYHSLPRMNSKGEYTISTDKTVSIAIFDQKFNWIGEQIVKQSHYFAGIVPHQDGALSMWGQMNSGKYYLSLVRHE
jgi:hypothetical protein